MLYLVQFLCSINFEPSINKCSYNKTAYKSSSSHYSMHITHEFISKYNILTVYLKLIYVWDRHLKLKIFNPNFLRLNINCKLICTNN